MKCRWFQLVTCRDARSVRHVGPERDSELRICCFASISVERPDVEEGTYAERPGRRPRPSSLLGREGGLEERVDTGELQGGRSARLACGLGVASGRSRLCRELLLRGRDGGRAFVRVSHAPAAS